MPEQKGKYKEAEFVSKIVKDPNQTPETLLLAGYIGSSSEENYVRLYMDAALSDSVEIPTDAILHVQEVPDAKTNLGLSYIWIKRDAEVLHGKVGTERVKAKFFEGRIQQEYAKAAAAGAAAGWFGPRTPDITVIDRCPTRFDPGCTTTQHLCPTSFHCPITTNCPTHPDSGCATQWCPTPHIACPKTDWCPQTAFCPAPPQTQICPQPTWACPQTMFCPAPQTQLCPQPTWICPQPTGFCPQPSIACQPGGGGGPVDMQAMAQPIPPSVANPCIPPTPLTPCGPQPTQINICQIRTPIVPCWPPITQPQICLAPTPVLPCPTVPIQQCPVQTPIAPCVSVPIQNCPVQTPIAPCGIRTLIPPCNITLNPWCPPIRTLACPVTIDCPWGGFPGGGGPFGM